MQEQKPYGAEPVNPLPDNSEPEVVEETEVVEEAPVEPDKPKDDNIARLEKMLNDSKSMVGKQSNEIGELRKKLEELTAPKDTAPPIEDQITDIERQMDEGEIPIRDGMKKILALNSKITASQVMSELDKQRQEEKFSEWQNNFIKDNPQFEEVVSSGALQPYLDADPMADEYVAYKLYQADQQLAQIKADYEAKVQAAKEEGAKLAKGAQQAGKVLGKQGASPEVKKPQGPWKSRQEAVDAMMAQLQSMRSTSA